MVMDCGGATCDATQKRMFGWNGILFGKEVITSSMTHKTHAEV